MLGGGGMAIPMALLSLCDDMMEVEEIHVVELHQVATWSEEIWRVKRCDLNDDDEIPLELPFQNLHVSIFFTFERMEKQVMIAQKLEYT